MIGDLELFLSSLVSSPYTPRMALLLTSTSSSIMLLTKRLRDLAGDSLDTSSSLLLFPLYYGYNFIVFGFRWGNMLWYLARTMYFWWDSKSNGCKASLLEELAYPRHDLLRLKRHNLQLLV